MSTGGPRTNGPLVAAGIVGLVAVSYIAYYLYRRSRRRRLLNYFKRIYNNDHELYDEHEEEHYSDEDDFYVDKTVHDKVENTAQEQTFIEDPVVVNVVSEPTVEVPDLNIVNEEETKAPAETIETVENVESPKSPKEPRTRFGAMLRSRFSKLTGRSKDNNKDDDWVSMDGSESGTEKEDKH